MAQELSNSLVAPKKGRSTLEQVCCILHGCGPVAGARGARWAQETSEVLPGLHWPHTNGSQSASPPGWVTAQKMASAVNRESGPQPPFYIPHVKHLSESFPSQGVCVLQNTALAEEATILSSSFSVRSCHNQIACLTSELAQKLWPQNSWSLSGTCFSLLSQPSDSSQQEITFWWLWAATQSHIFVKEVTSLSGIFNYRNNLGL